MKLRVVHPLNVEDLWLKVAPYIVQATEFEFARYDLECIKQQCLHGSAQIWIAHKDIDDSIEGVLVTEALFYAGIKTLCMRWASGENHENWINNYGLLEDWARKMGFNRIEVWGRKGWERAFKKEGFRYNFTVIGKYLDGRLQ